MVSENRFSGKTYFYTIASRGDKLKSRVGTSSGFVGCLRDFKLGRRPVALHSDHDPTVMVRLIDGFPEPNSALQFLPIF